MLIYFGLWLLAAYSLLVIYRRFGRQLPWLIISLLVFLSAYGAYRGMALHENQMWVRAILATLFILAGFGVIIINRGIRSTMDVAQRAKSLHFHGSAEDLAQQLRSSGFTILKNVQYQTKQFHVVAQNANFNRTRRLSFVETFFIVEQFDDLNLASFEEYCRICFSYAKGHRKIPLPWGWLFLHFTLCYPIAVTSAIDESLARSLIDRKPAWHWQGMELPAVWNTTDGRLYYSQATTEFPDTRGLSWDLMRETLVKVFRQE